MATPCSPVAGASFGRTDIASLLIGPGMLCAVVLALVVPSDAQVADAAPATDDRSISAGRWDVVAVEWDGSPVDQELLSRLQVVFQADGSWVVLLRSIPVAEGTSTNRQDTSPKTFEMQTLGSEGIHPSRFMGIYRFDGDTRVLCFAPDGKPRPEEFSAPRHSDRILVTLKRVQQPPKTK